MKDYTLMFIIMFISGALTTMNIWTDKIDDIRFTINDLYMVLLMTGWMFLFTGIYYKEKNIMLLGLLLVTINMWCIRTQFMVSEKQYLKGMIPHHSMAIFMSKKLLEKENTIRPLLENIIKNQQEEIDFMKDKEKILNL